jgi:hypothetical protein
MFAVGEDAAVQVTVHSRTRYVHHQNVAVRDLDMVYLQILQCVELNMLVERNADMIAGVKI